MINHGVSTGALFLLVGIVYERRHNRMIAEYGGLAKVMPLYAMFFMIITMSSIGLPTLNGFIGEFTILIGAFHHSWVWALFAATGIVLGAAYMLWMYQRVFFGELDQRQEQGPHGPQPARAVDPDPADHPGVLDRPLPEAVLQLMAAHRRSRARAGRGRHARAAIPPPTTVAAIAAEPTTKTTTDAEE